MRREFFILLVSKGYWRLSSVHPIHYLLYTGLLLVLHPSLFIQSLSKNYLFPSSRFSGKAFAKVRRFFVTSKFFRKFFFEKIFGRFSEGVRPILSRSLAHPQGKILGAAISTIFRSLKLHSVCHLQRLSLSKAVAKVQTFSFHATFTPYFFAGFFQVFS